MSSTATSGKGSVKTLAMTQLESSAKDKADKREAKKASPSSHAGSGNSSNSSPASSISTGSKVKTIAKKDKEAALAALEAISNISQLPTPSLDPTKPCACGGNHWRRMCNLLSDEDKALNYKRYEVAKINRMKVVNMTTLSKQTVFRCVYDDEATPTLDGAAGYDSMSEVHACPLAYESQLSNVAVADYPIYLNQVHRHIRPNNQRNS